MSKSTEKVKPAEKPVKKKSQVQWEHYFEQLSPEAQMALRGERRPAPPLSDEELAFQHYHGHDSPSVPLSLAPSQLHKLFPEDLRPGFWVVVQEEGENPVCRPFRNNRTALAAYLATLEGRDVFVHVFYGVQLHITTGPNRMLVMPDNSAIQFYPIIRTLQGVEDAVDLQADGFMGPPELQMPVNLKPKEDDNTDPVAPVEDEFEA